MIRLRADVLLSGGEELTAEQDELLSGTLAQLAEDLAKSHAHADQHKALAPMVHAVSEDARRRVLDYYRRELLPSMQTQILAVLEPRG